MGCTESVMPCSPLHAEYGEPRQPLKSEPMAENGRFSATQQASPGVPRDWFHGRTRQLSGFHWNLVPFASGKTVWLVAEHKSLGLQESLEDASMLGIA